MPNETFLWMSRYTADLLPQRTEETLLYEDEQLYRDGEHVGENRVGACGHTLGGSVGFAMIEREVDITDDYLATGSWELDIVGRRYPVTLSLEPMYDPKRKRIKV